MTTQTAQLATEYLMTVYAAMDPPQQIDDSLLIIGIPSGWAKGPKINATIIQPAGDWISILSNGSGRIDVRFTLKTDDAPLIYTSYNGVVHHPEETRERLRSGDVITSDDGYGMTAPVFRTSHPKYAWLNATQAIAKVTELKLGEGSFIKQDVFAVK